MFACASLVFAVSPLIMMTISPVSETAAREGQDMRGFYLFVTLPAGFIAAAISIAISARKPRRR